MVAREFFIRGIHARQSSACATNFPAVKYLGIIIDCNLNWKHHINYVTLKISKTVGIISKLRYYIPNNVLLDIYKSLISPYLTYGVAAWGNAAKVHIQKILVLQKPASRLMNLNHIKIMQFLYFFLPALCL